MLVPWATRTGVAFVPATGHRAEATVLMWYGLSWYTKHHRRRNPGDLRLKPMQPAQLVNYKNRDINPHALPQPHVRGQSNRNC